MRRRWYSRLLFIIFFFIIVFVLNSMLDSLSTNRDGKQKSSEEGINERLDSLEDSIRDLNKAIKNINQKQTTSSIKTQCTWRRYSPINTTFQIRQLYDNLPFDNPNGGVWHQGFDIQYNVSQWTSTNKLKIILMPHSHCDPGWLYTYEQYFRHSTRYILDTMLKMLDENEKYKFIWAEMSFLNLWWEQATDPQRDLLKKFVQNRRFEIVTGGWVMNDEANTHYYAMLDQLIEGHQFIENKFGNITIASSWANDPFGYSPTMAYLLQNSGINYIAIQRVHYHIKKALAKEKQLEFLWQQSWDRDKSTRIFTHILPFYGYDIPHTCGPDPKVCCQFDFKRGVDSYQSCAWGVDPTPITLKNVQERAQLLLDQYQKKAQLYRTNVLLIELGDDFRYRTIREAKLQFNNYDKLLRYINQQTDWNTEIKYGTLTDYFEELFQEKSLETFPSYTGDFFTYADRDDHYWSGYYTSRAFFKRMDRIVESYLRATEILFSFTCLKILREKINKFFPIHELFEILVLARRHLALFQHHDGITGTAKDHVVRDYGRKLLSVINITQTIMQESAQYLLFPNENPTHKQFLVLNQEFSTYDSLPKQRLLSFNDDNQINRTVYIYNPTDQRRIDIVKIRLNTYRVYVTSNQISMSTCQINPIWSNERSGIINQTQFELLILVNIEPYSMKEYTIHLATTEQSCPLATIEFISKEGTLINPSSPFDIKPINSKVIEISNRYLAIKFSKLGAILDIQHKKFDENLRFHTNIISYGTSKQSDHHSGAYIFVPNGNAQDIPINNYQFMRIQRGLLSNQIDIIHDMFVLRYELTNTNDRNDYAFKISATTHLDMNKDIELALRFSTGIKNYDEFFTDLNGFQMTRRKTYDKLPIQGNVYPMPTMAYIEDDYMRFTVLSSQPSGVACLKSGVVDVFLDRRLTRDDGRGLGQGIMDNRKTISTFKLLFERRYTIADRVSLTGYPTLLAHHLSIELLYPVHLFHSLISNISINELNLFSKSFILPSDYHLVNFRILNDNQNPIKYSPSQKFALILRRFAYDCNENYDHLFHFQQPIFQDLFPSNQIESINQTSLSLQYLKQTFNLTSKLSIPYAELCTYKIFFI